MGHDPVEKLAKEIELNRGALVAALDSKDIPQRLKININRVLQDRIDADKKLLTKLKGRKKFVEL